MKGYLSVTEAAEVLGVSRQRVVELIKLGLLDADRVGAHWILDEQSVRKRKEQSPKAGRPKSRP